MKSLLFAVLLTASWSAHAVDTNSQQYKEAVQAYKFWYPTVSMEGIMNGMREAGIKDNTHMFSVQSDSRMLGFTANQDTPYGAAVIDLSKGPYVIEMPAGPFMALVNDHDQRWIADMGIPGPDAGKGGKYLILPPNFSGNVPDGYHVGKALTNKMLIVTRVIPSDSDQDAAQEKIKDIKIYPLSSAKSPKLLSVVNINNKKEDMTSLRWEDNILFWEKLAKIMNEEPANDSYQAQYDQLKMLGVQKGKSFKPDSATRELLERAAQDGKKEILQMAFSSDRNDRIKWADRKWEWLVLTSDPSWAADHDKDPAARDRYFSQAIIMSPAMLRRDPTAGSLYWGAFRDASINLLDGGKTYKLTVPLPVPARLFWSVTLYDTDTRSLIANGTKKSSLRSLVELSNLQGAKSVDLYFGPTAPVGQEQHWIRTMPGKTWFSYFRIYGPQKGAFDNTWKPGDFTEVKSNSMAQTE